MGIKQGDDEVRELRAQLQNARNDVTRYASRMRRLELQLANVQGEAATAAAARESSTLEHASDVELRVDEAAAASGAWTNVLKAAEQTLQQCSCRGSDRTTELNDLQRFLQQQQQMIVKLGHENGKLRGQLHARPTRGQLVTAQLQIEHLRNQLHAGVRSKRSSRSQQRENETGAVDDTSTSAAPTESTEKRPDTAPPSLLEPLPIHTLSERISADKLLSWLRVETKPQVRRSKQAGMNRTFLKDSSVQCYLALDPAALAAHTTAAVSDKKNANGNQRNREQQQHLKDALERKVGTVCSEIVATCCHALRVKNVGELPQAVQAMSRLASIVPTFQRFLSKLQEVLRRLGEGTSRFALPKARSLPHEDLESLLGRAEDVAVELVARRKHMNETSGGNAFDALFELMTLLQVPQADQLQPIVLLNVRLCFPQRLIESSRAEKLFVLQLREIMGLKHFATRDDIFKIITKFMQQLKITTKLQQTDKEARVKPSQQT